MTRKIILLLFVVHAQSCIVYQRQAVSLSQAVDQGKAKIISSERQLFEYDEIILDDEIYYGLSLKFDSEGVPTIVNRQVLDEMSIDEIYLKSKSGSRIVSISTAVLIIGIGIFSLIWLTAFW